MPLVPVNSNAKRGRLVPVQRGTTGKGDIRREILSAVRERIPFPNVIGGNKATDAATVPADIAREVGRGVADMIPTDTGKAVGEFAADAVADTMTPRGLLIQVLGAKGAEKILANPAVENALAKAAGQFAKLQSGVRRQSGERLFKDPAALVKGFGLKKAGEELGKVREAAGLMGKASVDEIVDTTGRTSSRIAREVLTSLEKGEQVAADKLLKAKQALGNLIEATPFQQKTRRRLLAEAKEKVSDMLGGLSGEEAAASANYARAATGSEFLKMFPVTKGGDISVSRTLGLPALLEGRGLAVALPAAAVQSPALGGTAIASAGAGFKAAQAIMQNPAMRRAILAILASEAQGGNENSPE